MHEAEADVDLVLVSAHGRQVLVIVNDRGPYHADWVLDLGAGTGSTSAAVLRR